MPKFTLYYFDVRGRAEPIRLLFHYTNTPFNDIRIARQEWRAKKSSQLPVLEIDGQTRIAQSFAIARFLAKKHGLAGADELEAAQIDSVADLYKDFIEASAPYLHRKPNADKALLRQTLFEPALQRFFPLFERLIRESGSGFLTHSLSWADFFLAEGLLSLRNVEPECLEGHAELVAYEKRVHSLPQIKDYAEKRPFSEF